MTPTARAPGPRGRRLLAALAVGFLPLTAAACAGEEQPETPSVVEGDDAPVVEEPIEPEGFEEPVERGELPDDPVEEQPLEQEVIGDDPLEGEEVLDQEGLEQEVAP